MAEDELLYFYNQELGFIRELGKEFAAAHPKIAGRLKLGPKSIDDPHVARLIEAFALLNAKIRVTLEDDLPELRDTLLNIIYLHYQAPIPSMTVVQLHANSEKLIGKRVFPKGISLVTNPGDEETCEFMTCYPVTLWPIKVNEAKLTSQPLQAPAIPLSHHAKASLKLSLSCLNQANFATLNLDELRFFINAPLQSAYVLYGLLSQHLLAISVCHSDEDNDPLLLPLSCLKPVGFANEEEVLPHESRTFMGHRLLIEFFILPEKFLFFDLTALSSSAQKKLATGGKSLIIYFYFKQYPVDLAQQLNSHYFALGCTPVINLFKKTAEPIRLDHTKAEYHLVGDLQRPLESIEIYNIQAVTAIHETEGSLQSYHPFYGLTNYHDPAKTAYWHMTRRPSWYVNRYISGSEVFISFIDTNFNIHSNNTRIVRVDTLCTNRDLPAKLTFNESIPTFALSEKNELINKISGLFSFTPSLRPTFSDNIGWQLISHFSLNYLSLTEENKGLESLKEVLTLYDFSKSEEHQNLREALLNLTCRPKTLRTTTKFGTIFCQGLEINLEIDETKCSSTSLCLFGSIMERFFALYCSINSFTQLVISSKKNGELYKFLPRSGDKPMI